jgi:putative DNA primase/helicase
MDSPGNMEYCMTIETQFLNAARAGGIHLTGGIIADSTLHRAHIAGQRAGTKNGAYILHLDGHPAGWALDFTTGVSITWRADGRWARLSVADQAAIAAERQRRECEQQSRHKSAAEKARYILSKTQPITDPSQHPYLMKKRIQAHGARLSVWRSHVSLVVPVIGDQGLTSLQFIDPDGAKRFLSGGEIKGCYWGIGMTSASPASPCRILIAEGFATGASLHEWFQEPAIVAFNAGNLEPVAKRIRPLYPNHELIICGDSDKTGIGQKAARAAALACGGKYLLPPNVGTDFNDVVNVWRDAVDAEVEI